MPPHANILKIPHDFSELSSDDLHQGNPTGLLKGKFWTVVPPTVKAKR
jgi:hypothetical protein